MSAGTKPEAEGAAGGRDDAQSQFASYAQPMVSEALARAASLDPDPENLHKLRVALRRLRTLLWAWRPLLGCAFVEPRRALLKRAAAAAGEARDWDIAIALLERADAESGSAFADERLAAARHAARERVRQTLSAIDLKHALRDMLHDANRELNTSAHRSPIRRLARERVKAARRTLGKRMRRAQEAKRSDYAPWHEVRKGAKRLRYLLEFFEPTLPRRESRGVKSLKKLQDRFGKLNDAVASEQLLAQHREVFADAANADAALAALKRERKHRFRAASKLLG
ncbi:CHAD domain-containing protein [Paraburkholderia lycopersici]|uniref:CHAD domain-containing protein n=1 Tax=Paraburkholderia lycopersici TaxID=416944 RepID=A0A1G6H756_9BURK|nr:CHAD domain-containing protein [Paraburkholderia lycopersici]SDB90092.1 CHAD domain-containing protein [Paraburkholderia lycopersici]